MQRIRKLAPRAERAAAVTAVASVPAVLLLEKLPGEAWWPTYVLVYAPQQLWTLPAFFAAAYFAVTRQWLKMAGMTAFAAAALAFLMPWHTPYARRLSVSSSSATVRVLTWNMNRGSAGREFMPLVRKTLPDVVCLQEATPWSTRNLGNILRETQFRGWDVRTCGELVVLSRFHLDFVTTTHSALWTRANVDGTPITIVCAHFRTPISYGAIKARGLGGSVKSAIALRDRQCSQLMRQLDPTHDRTIVCGDLNTPPNCATYRTLSSRLKDSFDECGSGFGLTFPRRLSFVRIDHIMTGEGLTPVRCTVPRVSRSNHRPVCADINF